MKTRTISRIVLIFGALPLATIGLAILTLLYAALDVLREILKMFAILNVWFWERWDYDPDLAKEEEVKP